MCDISPLITFDVFGSGTDEKDTLFTLNKTCAQVTNPFNQYCLIPPTERLAQTMTCNPTLQNPRLPFVFTDAISGKIRTFQDLPIVFESFPSIPSSDPWVPNPEDQANRIFDFFLPNYNGFRPVSSRITRVVTNNTNTQMLTLQSQNNTGQSFQLFAMDTYGFLRPQFLTNGQQVETSALDVRQNCYMTANGSTQFALINGILLQPITDEPNTWEPVTSPIPLPLGILNVFMTDDGSFIALQYLNVILFLRPISFAALPFADPILWGTFTQNKAHLLICTLLPQGAGAQIHVINVQTGLIVFVWNAATLNLLQANAVYSAITTGNFTPSSIFNVIIARPDPLASVKIMLSVPAGTATLITSPPQPVITAFVGPTAWLQLGETNLFFIDGSTIPITPGVWTILWANPTTTRMYGFFQEQLWSLTIATREWTNAPSPVYMSANTVINDEYITSFPPLVEMWYLGKLFINVPLTIAVNDILGKSRHERFRLVITAIVSATDVFFAYVTLRLERVNNYFLLTSEALGPALLYEDANLMVGDVWQSRTKDEASDPASFLQWIIIAHPLVTSNGLYILFLNTITSTVRVVYNVFNSPQFAEWCAQDPEYLSNAIENQATFCFNNLALEDGKSFFDPRCACIGGSRLMKILYPAATIDSNTSGRLETALPCILNDCGRAFALGPEQSNAYAFTQQSCKQDVTMCSDVINVGVGINANKLQIVQNCGQDPTACRKNEECPIGTVCVNGQCVVSCTTDARCKSVLGDPLATCNPITGQCLYNTAVNKDNSSRTLLIVIIVLGALIFLMFLLLLAFFVDKPKKPKPQPSAQTQTVK